MIINIGATADPDLPIAQALASKFNGHVVWGEIDLAQITEDIIIVGGQLANQTYNWLVQQGFVPSLRQETAGFGSIFYLKLFGRNVWVMTGWDVQDTGAAGTYAINMGLPYVSRVIPLTSTKQVIQVNFPYSTQAGMDLLDSRIGDVLIGVTNRIGDFGLIDAWVDKQGKNLFILRDKSALRLVAIADDVLVAFMIIVGSVIGLIVLSALGWKWISTVHDKEVTERAEIRSSIVQDINDDPTTTAEEKEALIRAYYTGEKKIMQQETKGNDIFTVIKWALLIAAIGVGGYFVMKGITPLIKAKREG